MASHPRLSQVRLKTAPPHMATGGLIGWVSCIIDDAIRVDGITLRENLEGKWRLSWPCKNDKAGREHSVVAPLDEQARLDLEAQVFRALHARPGGRP